MNVEEVSSVVVDTAFHLHRDLGPGLLESVYEAVFAPPDPACRIAYQLRCSDLQEDIRRVVNKHQDFASSRE